MVTAFLLRRVEIPKCDNHRLGPFVTSAVRDGAGCRLTVHWLDTVALDGEPVVHLFFKWRKVLGPVRRKQSELRRHSVLRPSWSGLTAAVFDGFPQGPGQATTPAVTRWVPLSRLSL